MDLQASMIRGVKKYTLPGRNWRRNLGLPHQASDAPVRIQVGHSEALRIINRSEQNAGAAFKSIKALHMADYAITGGYCLPGT